MSDRPVEAEPIRPDAAAFDDEDEATELASVEPSPPPGIKAMDEVDEDDAPTDPGRDMPEIPGPTPLPPPPEPAPEIPAPQATRAQGRAVVPAAEPSLVPQMPPSRTAEPTGHDFLVPRRRRAKVRPNYVGWVLVFVGMVSGLGGLVLLALSALRVSGSA